MKFAEANGAASDGAIVAFKVEDQGGKPSLTPQWVSRDMLSPASPVTANGLVFALSTGLSPRVAKPDGSWVYPDGYAPFSAPVMIDTTKPGFSNAGHEAEVSGLSSAERDALIEYLKLL